MYKQNFRRANDNAEKASAFSTDAPLPSQNILLKMESPMEMFEWEDEIAKTAMISKVTSTF